MVLKFSEFKKSPEVFVESVFPGYPNRNSNSGGSQAGKWTGFAKPGLGNNQFSEEKILSNCSSDIFFFLQMI